MLDSRRNVLWIVIGGAVCLLVLIFLVIPLHQESNPKLPSHPPSPITRDSPDDDQDTGLIQSPVAPSKQSELEKKPFPPLPPPDQAAEIHRKVAAGFNGEIREATRRLYGAVFHQLGLPLAVQEKVIDILTQQQKQLEQQAFEAAQGGSIPDPPSPESIRAQQFEQDQQLRAALGDAGFAKLSQYQATIPDRLIVNEMNQQGANLSESQSNELLKVLTEARQQIIVQPGAAQNLGATSPENAMTMIQQQQTLLQQTVNARVQTILTPDQQTTLQGVLSRLSNGPKPR